jgi:hypothetical protein
MMRFPVQDFLLKVSEYAIYGSFAAFVIAMILAIAVLIVARGRW